MPSNLIWGDWLVAGRCIGYRNCNHVEYVECADRRSATADELRRIIESHHACSATWMRLISVMGFPCLSEALQQRIVLPSQTTAPIDDNEEERELTTRRGNFCEVLAAEYVLTQMDFEVPIRRLRYNPNPNQSMKGDDVLGFRFPPLHNPGAVLVGESKYRSRKSPAAIQEVVKEAYNRMCASPRLYPASMDFVATILELEQDQERAQMVRQMRERLRSGQMAVERHYLIFLGTLGRPDNPFGWLDAQHNVVANITGVNVVFASGIQDWLNELFDIGQ